MSKEVHSAASAVSEVISPRRRGQVVPFKQSAIKRAINAVRVCGLEPSEVVISPSGEIRLSFGGRSEDGMADLIASYFPGAGREAA